MAGDANNISFYELLDKYQFKFYKYYHVLFKVGLKPNEVHTLSIILSFNKAGQDYIGSCNFLSKELNITSRTALNTLTSLINKGFIRKQSSKGGNVSIYSINEKFLKDIFLNYENFSQLTDNKPLQNVTVEQWKNSTVNSEKNSQLTDNKDVVNYEKNSQKPCKNFTVNYEKISHNKNIYKNNNKNIYITNSKTKKEKEEKQKKSASNKKAYSKKDFICDIESYSDDEELRQSLIDFYDMRKAQKKDINTSGITKRLLNKLDKLSGGDIEIKKAIVDKAIESSWLSFYPLKDADIATVKNKNNNGVILTKEEKEALEKPSIPPFIKDLREKEEKGELLTDDEKYFLSKYRNL